MSKSQRFNGVKTTLTLAASNPIAASIFGGKTLNQVGFQYGLSDDDISFKPSVSRPDIWSLVVAIPEGVLVGETPASGEYVIPLSRKFDREGKATNPDYLLNCMFRTSHLSVKDDDGAPKVDEDGKVILDETKPYLTFGQPDGIQMAEGYGAFEEPTEADLAAATAGMKAGK